SWNAMLISMSWLPSLSAAALSEPSAVRKLCCAPCHGIGMKTDLFQSCGHC
ncbi:unnamed protein product, partial [Rangifer tarandus platyrhynchus]